MRVITESRGGNPGFSVSSRRTGCDLNRGLSIRWHLWREGAKKPLYVPQLCLHLIFLKLKNHLLYIVQMSTFFVGML